MRSEVTSEDLVQVIENLGKVSAILARTVEKMRSDGVDAVLMHSSAATKHWIPDLLSWAERTELDVARQIREFQARNTTNAVKRKAEYERVQAKVKQQKAEKSAEKSAEKLAKKAR